MDESFAQGESPYLHSTSGSQVAPHKKFSHLGTYFPLEFFTRDIIIKRILCFDEVKGKEYSLVHGGYGISNDYPVNEWDIRMCKSVRTVAVHSNLVWDVKVSLEHNRLVRILSALFPLFLFLSLFSIFSLTRFLFSLFSFLEQVSGGGSNEVIASDWASGTAIDNWQLRNRISVHSVDFTDDLMVICVWEACAYLYSFHPSHDLHDWVNPPTGELMEDTP